MLAVVKRVPVGRVTTYGDVARLAGRPGAARAVGNVMRKAHDQTGPAVRAGSLARKREIGGGRQARFSSLQFLSPPSQPLIRTNEAAATSVLGVINPARHGHV